MPSLLTKWWKSPLQIGSISSASKELADLMISQVPKEPKVIVEFGAGTGPITKVLAHRFPDCQIYAFELDPDLARSVQEDNPSVRVFANNVTESPGLLPQALVGKVDVILSSLPFLTLPKGLDHKIIQCAFDILKPNGSFVQYTYLPVLPPIQVYRDMGLWAQFVGAEWRNLPPAFVWSFRQDVARRQNEPA